MVDMNNKYKSIVSMLAQMNGQTVGNKDNQAGDSVTPSPTSSGILTQGSDHSTRNMKGMGDARSNTKLPKIDFPYFSGEGPREWVRKSRKYFQIHQVPEELKVGIA